MSSLTGSGDTPPGRSNLRLLAPALDVSAKLEPFAPLGNWSSLARQGIATPQLIRQINRSHHKCNSGRTAGSPSLISTAFRCRAHGPSRTPALLKVSSIHSHRRHVLQFHHRLRRSVQCHVTMFIATVTTKSDAGSFLVVSVDGMAWFSRIYHPHGSPQHELGRLLHLSSEPQIPPIRVPNFQVLSSSVYPCAQKAATGVVPAHLHVPGVARADDEVVGDFLIARDVALAMQIPWTLGPLRSLMMPVPSSIFRAIWQADVEKLNDATS